MDLKEKTKICRITPLFTVVTRKENIYSFDSESLEVIPRVPVCRPSGVGSDKRGVGPGGGVNVGISSHHTFLKVWSTFKFYTSKSLV